MVRRNSSPPIAIFGEFNPAELADAAGRGAEATTRAAATLERLRRIFHGADQIDLLSRLAFLCVIGLPDGRAPRREPFVQTHELELLQAIALNGVRVVTRDTAGMPQVVEDLLGLASEHTAAVREMSFARLGNDAGRNRVEAVLDRMRGTTHTVRGPRHAYQTRAYCRDLAVAMDGEFEAALGFTVTDTVAFLEGFAEQASRRLGALQGSARRWMRAGDANRMLQLFSADIPGLAGDDVVTGLRSARIPATQTRTALHALFEEQLKDVFVVEWPGGGVRQARLRDGVQRLSLQFGEVGDNALPHLKLSNPVQAKPFVHGDDGHLHLFCMQTALANMVELINGMTEATPSLRKRCEKFKSRWLERRLQKLVASAFPSGSTVDNAKWTDTDGKPGETDCILLVDKTVGLFEAKSGRVSPSARRGAEDRLRREIGTLLVEPSRQSARLAGLLRSDANGVELETAGGKETIPPSDIREIVRVNVLFDTLGPLTAGTRRLVEAGFVGPDEPMTSSMSVFELETLFDILPDQVSRLHYLRRREQIERELMIEADEMDLIAFYLESSFCIAELASDERGFSIYGWSAAVAQVYDHEGRRGRRPVLKRTPFFNAMIAAVETSAKPGWTRFGYRLANVPYRDQWKVLRRRNEIASKARRLPPGKSAFSGVYDHGGKGGTVIGLCVGKDVSLYGIQGHSLENAAEIARLADADEGMVLYWDVNDNPGELRFVASFKRPR